MINARCAIHFSQQSLLDGDKTFRLYKTQSPKRSRLEKKRLVEKISESKCVVHLGKCAHVIRNNGYRLTRILPKYITFTTRCRRVRHRNCRTSIRGKEHSQLTNTRASKNAFSKQIGITGFRSTVQFNQKRSIWYSASTVPSNRAFSTSN